MGFSVKHRILEAINIGYAGDTKAPRANLNCILDQINLVEAEEKVGVIDLDFLS